MPQRVAGWFAAWVRRAQAALARRLTERRELHGLAVSVFDDSFRTDSRELWAKLEDALGLIAAHGPAWTRRMRRLGVSIDVRNTPGTRAKLLEGKTAVLDAYFVSAFLPAQVAASIVHEATHALVRARGVAWSRETLAREERMCRRAELRFGRVLAARGVEGAGAVAARARDALALADDEVAPVVDWRELAAAAEVSRLEQLPLPLWLKRRAARRRGLLETDAGRKAFGR